MDMPNELYVAYFVECIEGRLNPVIIIGIFSDAACAEAAMMADMNEFAEDMDATWTIDKWSRRAVNKNNRSVKWGVTVGSVHY